MSDNEDEKTTELPLGKEAEANLFKSRSIFIYGGITQELAHKVCAQLVALAAASDDDIRIFVNSPGGHVESGDLIHDMIKFIKPKVWIIGTGWVGLCRRADLRFGSQGTPSGPCQTRASCCINRPAARVAWSLTSRSRLARSSR